MHLSYSADEKTDKDEECAIICPKTHGHLAAAWEHEFLAYDY